MTTLAELEARLRNAERRRLSAETLYVQSLLDEPLHPRCTEMREAAIGRAMARNEALLALLEARMREQGREVRRGGE